jgi:hypothetical protein
VTEASANVARVARRVNFIEIDLIRIDSILVSLSHVFIYELPL